MLTLKILSSTALIIAFGLTGCASSYQRSAPTPLAPMAEYIMGDVKNTNLTNQDCVGNDGSAAYARAQDNDGTPSTFQLIEAWNVCGTPLPADVRRRHQQQEQQYNDQQPQYDSRSRHRRSRY